jgi:hypothetical protein
LRAKPSAYLGVGHQKYREINELCKEIGLDPI